MGTLEAAQARVLASTPRDEPTISFRWRSILDGLTVLLAIASIFFAYVQKLDSRELKNTTETLVRSATTGYIAEFPQSIPAITRIAQGTCSELSIMADLPGYGQYSAPEAFYSYMHAIIDLRHISVKNNLDAGHCVGRSVQSKGELGDKTKVRLLLFSPDEREVYLKKQLNLDLLRGDLSNRADSSGRDKIVNFLNANQDLLHEKPEEILKKLQAGSGYEEFIGVILATQRDAEKEFKKAGVEIRYIRQPSIMRVWIGDKEEAAFSFDHSSETEIAFQTRDAKLLDNFTQIFQQHWDDSVCYEDYWSAKDKNATIRMDQIRGCH